MKRRFAAVSRPNSETARCFSNTPPFAARRLLMRRARRYDYARSRSIASRPICAPRSNPSNPPRSPRNAPEPGRTLHRFFRRAFPHSSPIALGARPASPLPRARPHPDEGVLAPGASPDDEAENARAFGVARARRRALRAGRGRAAGGGGGRGGGGVLAPRGVVDASLGRGGGAAAAAAAASRARRAAASMRSASAVVTPCSRGGCGGVSMGRRGRAVGPAEGHEGRARVCCGMRAIGARATVMRAARVGGAFEKSRRSSAGRSRRGRGRVPRPRAG